MNRNLLREVGADILILQSMLAFKKDITLEWVNRFFGKDNIGYTEILENGFSVDLNFNSLNFTLEVIDKRYRVYGVTIWIEDNGIELSEHDKEHIEEMVKTAFDIKPESIILY